VCKARCLEAVMERVRRPEAGDDLQTLRKQVRLAPENGAIWNALGIACARSGEVAEGVVALQRALELLPGHVLSKAYLGILFHMSGRHGDAVSLLDYEGMVESHFPFDGKPDELAEFNAALISHLESHPSRQWSPATKATKGGWQTGELLADGVPVVQWLSAILRKVVRDALCDGSAEANRFAAEVPISAWGISLSSGGYQEPHVHQASLLSGVYYASVPFMSGPVDAGALRFPRTLPWVFGRAPGMKTCPQCLVIRPAAGQLVLFPSHFWHETVAFHSDSQRVSIAFDLLPPKSGSMG
jgi:uncharacterized protein (TIGR02466 family)